MSCDRCSARINEDFQACKNAECTYHETFYAEQLKKELNDSLILMSDFLWYDSVPNEVKVKTAESLDRNNIEYTDGWQEEEE